MPKGAIEFGETSEDAAARELNEETGLEGTLHRLARFSVSPGYLSQCTDVFVAWNVEEAVVRRSAEPDERFELLSLPLEEAISALMHQPIVEARTIAGLLLVRDALPG